MKLGTISKWFFAGVAIILVGLFAFVFTVNEITDEDVSFLIVNESNEATEFTVTAAEQQIFFGTISTNQEAPGPSTEFEVEVSAEEFILEVTAGSVTERTLVDLDEGENIAITYLGSQIVINQSEEPFLRY